MIPIPNGQAGLADLANQRGWGLAQVRPLAFGAFSPFNTLTHNNKSVFPPLLHKYNRQRLLTMLRKQPGFCGGSPS